MSELDEFGRRKIYRNSTDPKRAKPWLLGKDDWKIRLEIERGDFTTFIEDGELVFNFKESKGRNYVVAIPSVDENGEYKSQVTETNQRKLRKRGYMGTPADWKNVEITLYARVRKADFENLPRLSLAARGYHHHSGNNPFGDACEGSAYYTVLKVDGSIALQKELFHDNGYSAEEYGKTHLDKGDRCELLINPNNPPGPDSHCRFLEGRGPRWIGMKGIFYNNINGNPKLELWLDKNADNDWGTEAVLAIEDSFNHTISDYKTPGNDPYDQHGWFLVRKEYTDENGTWPRTLCGAEANERITWGGPAIILRWDAISNLDIKWASVREIVPPEMSLRNLFKANRISIPVDIGSVAQFLHLPFPISIRDLAARLL